MYRFNEKVKSVKKVKVVNKGMGLDDNIPVDLVELESGKRYLHEYSKTAAGGARDVFFPLTSYKKVDGCYDISSRKSSRGKVEVL